MKVHIVTNTQKDKDRSVTEAIVRELLDLGVEVIAEKVEITDEPDEEDTEEEPLEKIA